jgi:hypothetical protein
MTRETLLNLARQVSPLNAQKYLLAKGWKRAGRNPRPGIILFNHRSDRYKQIIVPKLNDYELYPNDLLLLAISRLEEIENRDAVSILGQMIAPDADILRYRILSPQAESGTLTLSAVQTLISGVVSSLSAAVCDVLLPGQIHHKMVKTKDVKSLLEKAQFGQTEHGSFVVKVVAPLDSQNFPSMSDGGTRRGIIHLLESVKAIVKTVEKGRTARFIREGRDSPPFSGNLVNSIVDMQLWQDADIEISSEWAPTLPPDRGVDSTVFIPSGYFGEIEKICRGFAPKDTENPVEVFSGFVIELCGETDETEQKYGDVVVQLSRSDGESFPATVYLPMEQHQDAIKSYEKNLPVYFSGKLVRDGVRKRRIQEVSFFKLLDSER